jgi:hypothetical protein
MVTMAMVSTTAFAKGGDGGADIMKNGPRVERGERVNWGPSEKHAPSPVERVFKAIADSPVRPTIKDGQPAIQLHKSFP